MKHQFLPGREHLEEKRAYWGKIKEGEHKFRVVQGAVGGWIEWTAEKQPIRYRPDQKPSKPIDPANPPKKFWTFYVWDYAREDLFILEIQQKGIIKAIEDLVDDEDWGPCTDYDIKLKRQGTTKNDTKYTVTPLPKKPMSERILKALEASPVRLEALYEGGNPWADLTAFNKETGEVHDPGILTETQCDELDAITLKDAVLEKKICDNLKIDNIYRTPAKDFDRVRDYAEKYRDNLEKKRNIA
jgi:hypothetical protein